MRNLFIVTTFLSLSTTAMATNCKAPINIKEFHKNPKAFLNAPVIKLGADCRPVSKSYFSAKQIESKEFITIKDQQRKSQCHTTKDGSKTICLKDLAPGENVITGRAPIESIDRAENLVTGGDVLDSLEDIAELELESGKVTKQPWSDWYWPIAVGQLSFRYGDDEMVQAYQDADLEEEQIWLWMRDYHEEHLATPADINKLSPSEKYDVLMGDTEYTLTKQMINAGKAYYDQYGKVDSWMGLCHGWSPASFMLDRPANSISVKAADGITDIPFRPSDLKALGTLLWATGKSQTKFVGGRCNAKDPKVDEKTGRILDQECFDNNPGTWHQAIVTEVGMNKKSFVMDATYDYEVWNHPVTAYEYSYFNPKSTEEFDSLNEAIMDIKDFDNDKFVKFRSPKAKYVVGIMMEVNYMVETMPSKRNRDEEWMDASNTAYYVYDLELDAEKKIIGGEWYTNKHPDFVWAPHEGSHAESILDSYLPESLTMDFITHPEITKFVPQVSAQSQPIGKVVEALIRESVNQKEGPSDIAGKK